MRLCLSLFFVFFTSCLLGQIDRQEYKGEPGFFSYDFPNGLLQHTGSDDGTIQKGTQYWYFPNDQLSRKVSYAFTCKHPSQFENALLKEVVTLYDEGGTFISITGYINGIQLAEDDNYYPDGGVKYEEKRLEDGKHLVKTYYYLNGNKRYETTGFEGDQKFIRDGKTRHWNEQGIKCQETDYVNGLKHGELKNYNDAGQLLYHGYFKNDTAYAKTEYNAKGEKIGFWDKNKPLDTHFQLLFHGQTDVLRSRTTYKRVIIDADTLHLRIEELYDKKGNYQSTHIRHLNFSTPIYRGIEGVVKEHYVHNKVFSLVRENHPKHGERFHLHSFQRPVDMGFWLDSKLIFDCDKSPDAHDKLIDQSLQKVKRKIKFFDDLSPKYRTDLANLPNARIYHTKFPREVFFDSATTITALDSLNTGSYRIKYHGTEMYYEGHLLEGFEHGTSTLYLNDTIKLFEYEFRHGFQHGTSRDWYLNGNLANETIYNKGKITASRKYYLSGGLAFHEQKNSNGVPILKDVWNKDKKLESSFWKEDSILYSIQLDPEDGSFRSYGRNDLRHNIIISHTVYKGRDFATIDIPKETGWSMQFSFERYGYRIEGEARWDEQEQKSVLTDKYGQVNRFDRSVISYPKKLPCECRDWEEYDFFAPPTTDFVSLKTFKRYQHDFHAPVNFITGTFGDPYYLKNRPARHLPGNTYRVHSTLIGAKPLTFFLPDSNHISLTIEPCKSKFAFVKYTTTLQFKVGFPKETRVTFHQPKSLALNVPSTMLVQLGPDYTPLEDKNGKPMDGLFLFNAREIQYNRLNELDILDPYFVCARPMRIGRTGLILTTRNLWPDFSQTKNPSLLNEYLQTLKKNNMFNTYAPGKAFRGAFITKGVVSLPTANGEYVDFTITNLMLSAQKCMGTVLSTSIINSDGVLEIQTQSGQLQSYTQYQLKQLLGKMGLVDYQLEFKSQHPAIIHFYYHN